jgi:hypothetical protein
VWRDVIAHQAFDADNERLHLSLSPYEVLWLVEEPAP